MTYRPLAAILSIIVPLVFFTFVNWRIIRKAGRPGWEALIPFYNGWGLAEVSGRPGIMGAVLYGILFSLRFLEPLSRGTVSILTGALTIIGFSLHMIISFGLAKHFKKSNAVMILIVLLPFIGYPVLAFDGSNYRKLINKENRNA